MALKSGIETITLNGKTIPANITPLDTKDFTRIINLAGYVYDLTTAGGSATFSDFSFTPLP